jgi:hypothetical protein
MINNPHVPRAKQLDNLIHRVGVLDLTLIALLKGPKFEDPTSNRAAILDQMLLASNIFRSWLVLWESDHPNIRTPYTGLTE